VLVNLSGDMSRVSWYLPAPVKSIVVAPPNSVAVAVPRSRRPVRSVGSGATDTSMSQSSSAGKNAGGPAMTSQRAGFD
jgi:hypothetical protein